EKAEKVSQDIPVLTSIVEPGKTLHESQSISNEIENLLSAFDQPEPGEIPVSNLAAGPELSTPESDDRQKPKPIEKIHKQTGKSQTKEAKEKAELKEEPKPVVQKVASKKKTVAAEEENPLLALLDHMDDNSFDGDFRKPSAGMSVKSRLQRFQFNEWVPKAILAIIVLIVVVPALSFWLMTQKVIEVNTYKVETGPIHSLISVPGRIDSKRKIKVSAREGGQLVKVNIKEGDIITKDQVLAQIDDSEARSNIKRAEARLLSIEEEVALTSKTQERLQRALDVGAVSRQMVEDAEANWKTASAKQSVIEEELKSAELKRDRLKIKAPFDGIVTAVFAQEGQWVSQAEELFTLVDMKQRVVEISVDASDSGSLSVGQTVVLRSGAFDGKEWSEEIIKIGSAAKSENSANVIKVTTSFGKNAPDLRVGQQVDAEIRTSSRADALLLPYELIFNHNGAQTVAVIENGSVVFVPIETGIESFTRIEVTNGLRVGQHVIIPAGIPLEQGMNAISVGAQTF
ncbi:MAG: efflux RND transporter periplasmic adaptor subunit, partial [Gammaproteobacteria bacterium]|nr:efflux RND transporter periplasmic adaptor subunit [Gammaproteobacteria bacterium]